MPRYREEVIIPLGKGCIAILSLEEASRLLAQHPELWEKAVKRGKHRRRAEKNSDRQAKPRPGQIREVF
ncbi:hypothetical protein [Thermodesulfitimonas autotrophica]|uniref:hypothetical protein n=1 Tax=Thermodesulfitimonas autotrophica TaxID=1894989 RepID=UPI000F4F72C5|nr:hypothetical protein [Thermodesulfitimonas autotrophica]